MDKIIYVDPSQLRIGAGRHQGADPEKLQKQLSRFGRSLDGMPPLWVSRAKDGELVIMNGITRATRAARFCPGELVPVVVIDKIKSGAAHLPTVRELMP